MINAESQSITRWYGRSRSSTILWDCVVFSVFDVGEERPAPLFLFPFPSLLNGLVSRNVLLPKKETGVRHSPGCFVNVVARHDSRREKAKA